MYFHTGFSHTDILIQWFFLLKYTPTPKSPPPPRPHTPLIQHILNHPKPDLFNTVITGIVLYWQQTETTIDTESQVCCVNQTYDSPITQGIDAGKRRICCGNTPHIQHDKCKSSSSNSNNIVLTYNLIAWVKTVSQGKTKWLCLAIVIDFCYINLYMNHMIFKNSRWA